MKHKNMKIEINAEQPLNEVVAELERLGYRKRRLFSGVESPRFICGCDDMGIMDLKSDPCVDIYKTTTLTELKGMKL